jgi:hypothetical protein
VPYEFLAQQLKSIHIYIQSQVPRTKDLCHWPRTNSKLQAFWTRIDTVGTGAVGQWRENRMGVNGRPWLQFKVWRSPSPRINLNGRSFHEVRFAVLTNCVVNVRTWNIHAIVYSFGVQKCKSPVDRARIFGIGWMFCARLIGFVSTDVQRVQKAFWIELM